MLLPGGQRRVCQEERRDERLAAQAAHTWPALGIRVALNLDHDVPLQVIGVDSIRLGYVFGPRSEYTLVMRMKWSAAAAGPVDLGHDAGRREGQRRVRHLGVARGPDRLLTRRWREGGDQMLLHAQLA